MREKRELIKTIQPYFVMSTSHFYQEIVAKYGISHFYCYDIDENSDEYTIVVPDGCVDLYFEYDERGISGRACGTVLNCSRIRNPYRKSVFGIRFMPGVVPVILDISMRDLVNQEIPLEEICKVPGLNEKIYREDSFEGKTQAFMEDYLKCMALSSKPDSRKLLVTAVKDMIYETDGDIRVSELEDYTGYTGRYLDKIFTEDMGYSTKTFCRIIKFQRILDCLKHDPSKKLADFALEFGYYDQAHFIHDFKTWMGMTPRQYRKCTLENDFEVRICDVGKNSQ